jgi:hypothetical protein
MFGDFSRSSILRHPGSEFSTSRNRRLAQCRDRLKSDAPKEDWDMARVVRIDTSEYIGYFFDLVGPLEPGAQGYIFDAWHYPDGRLRHEPPSVPTGTRGPFQRPAPVKLSIPVRNPRKVDLELMVPPDYLDFIQCHPAFHPFPPRPARL